VEDKKILLFEKMWARNPGGEQNGSKPKGKNTQYKFPPQGLKEKPHI